MTDPPPEHLTPGQDLPQGRLGRSLPLAGLTLRTAGAAASAAWHAQPDAVAVVHSRATQRYAELLGRSRGALMKAGQLLSLVALAPAVPAAHRAVYQEALTRLQDDAPPMPASLASAVVEAELHRPLGQIFAGFGPRPIAAASIGRSTPPGSRTAGRRRSKSSIRVSRGQSAPTCATASCLPPSSSSAAASPACEST